MTRSRQITFLALAALAAAFVLAWLLGWPMPWDWNADDWTGLTFVVLVAGAIVAYGQAQEARLLRKEQARPFVVIEFLPVEDLFVELRIANIGRTLATDVKFSFDQPLTTTDDGPPRGPLMDLNIFTRGMASLAPGSEVKLYFDQFPDRIDAALPMTYTGNVAYSDPAGDRYTQPIVLDLDMYVGTGSVKQYGIHDIYKQIKRIADATKKWTDMDGLKIMTRKDRRERNAEILRRHEERHAAGRPDDGD